MLVLGQDVWSEVCWQLVEGRNVWPEHDTCEWRLPWAQLLVDVGNLSCACKAARDGCRDAMARTAAVLRRELPQEQIEINNALRPVVEGRGFSLRAVRRLLPFTAASRAKLHERLRERLFLQRATAMPLEVLNMRREEGSQVVTVRSARFLVELQKLGDPTALRLLRFPWTQRLEGCAFHVIPELRLRFGTSQHGWRYAKRLGKQMGYPHGYEERDPYCGCSRCRGSP